MKLFPILFAAAILTIVSCGSSGNKPIYTLEASGDDAVFAHREFSVTFPGQKPEDLTVLPSDDSTGYSVTTPQNVYPFYQLFFKKSKEQESKWDDNAKQQEVQQREADGDYDIRFRQVEVAGGVQAYETAYTNFFLNEVGEGELADTVTQYTRELKFVHRSMVYWLELTSEDREIPEELAARFFGSFKLKKK
jgi:hypothetical protein